MPTLPPYPRTATCSLLLAAAMLSGCASLEPVKQFADETRQVGAAFAVMPAATTQSCHARELLRDYTMPASTRFKLAELSQRYKQTCGPDADASRLLLPFAVLLEQYADTLAALASDELPDYKEELDGLGTAVAGLKDRNGEAVIPANKAGAVIDLGKLLGDLATRHAARGEIRKLLAQQEGLEAAAGALRWYTNRIYRPMLNSQVQVIDITIDTALPNFEAREPLAARSMMVSLAQEKERVIQLEQAATNYIASIDKVVATRATLLAKLDQPKDEQLREELRKLATEVRALRKKLAGAG